MCNNFNSAVKGMMIIAVAIILIASLPISAKSQGGEMIPFAIEIGNNGEVTTGQTIIVPVIKTAGSQPIFGFDFLIGYDESDLAFLDVVPGDLFDESGAYEWEYFSFRYIQNSNCGVDCPSGLVRVIGYADENDGPHHPLDTVVPDGMVLFELNFLAVHSLCPANIYASIDFYWMDCGDNSIATEDSSGAAILAISENVYDSDGNDITNPYFGFPSYYGAQFDCIDSLNPGNILRFTNFKNGGVNITSDYSGLEDRGDINLNGIANEIADYVVFANYFLYGLSALNINTEGQIAASDINADGITLTTQDYAYLLRIIEGVLSPISDTCRTPDSSFAGTLDLHYSESSLVVNSDFDEPVGVLYLQFDIAGYQSIEDFSITAFPEVAYMDMGYDTSGNVLNILVCRLDGSGQGIDSATIPPGSTDVLNISFTGDPPDIIRASAAGYLGRNVDLTVNQSQEEAIPFGIEIGTFDDALLGSNISIPVNKTAGSQPILGFDFLLGYDGTALTLLEVAPGELFDDPGDYEWEYFNYRFISYDSCGGDCPSGLVRIIGLADQNDGPNHPLETVVPDGMVIFDLNFGVTSDSTLGGLFTPLRFYWMDCGDNAISYNQNSLLQLAISRAVFDYDGAEITDFLSGFPTYNGPIIQCFTGTNHPEPFIDFYNGGVYIMNLDNTSDITAHWGDTVEFDVPAVDPDPGNSCEDLTFTLIQGPGVAELDSLTGHFFWPTTGDDICNTLVIIQITDGCSATAEYGVYICIQNDAPQTTINPDDTIYVGWEHNITGQVEAADPDNGPNPLIYRIASFNGPTWFAGGMQIDSVTGVWAWGIAEDAEYLGDFELVVEISDGAEICSDCSGQNADTAVYNIHVIGQAISIEKTHEQSLGSYAKVSIVLDSTFMPNVLTQDLIGGFDFLITYDPSILTALYVAPGSSINEDGFEYFTYRLGPFGNCPDCPAGLVRVIGIRETNDGVVNDFHLTTPGELVELQFHVTSDTAYECWFTPIRFYWIDCGDNTVSDESGNWLFLGPEVYDWDYSLLSNSDTVFGVYGPDPNCHDTLYTPTETFQNCPMGSIIFRNGGIDIECIYHIEDRGDVNLNGIPNEIADFVVFQNYFYFGPSAFTINYEGQKAATDINADGVFLTIQDLTYLLRIIDGNLQPIPESYKGPGDSFDGALYISETDSSIIISSDFADSVGILYMTFTAPGVQSDSEYVINVDPGIAYLNVGSHGYSDNVRILIWQYASGPPENDSASIKPGFRKLLEIYSPGGKPVLDSALAAGFLAEYVNVTVYDLPSTKPILEPYPSAMTNDYYGGFEYQFSASYPDKSESPLRYNIISGPGDLDPITGLWKFSPLCVDSGTTYTLEVCVSDPIHPCESGDSTQTAVVELSIVNETPLVGDADGDGEVAFEDIIRVIAYKYLSGDEPLPSYQVADVNADGMLNIFDIVYMIYYLYLDGPEPQCPAIG